MKLKTSVAVGCLLPGRAKDISAPMYNYMPDTVLLPTVFMFQVRQPYNSNSSHSVLCYSHDFS